MRVSKLAKVASIALAFGLVATTPAHAANFKVQAHHSQRY